MKTVKRTGERTGELIKVVAPKVQDEFCLVKIMSAPMCTEVKDYSKVEISDCLGHEAAGEIIEAPWQGRVKIQISIGNLVSFIIFWISYISELKSQLLVRISEYREVYV